MSVHQANSMRSGLGRLLRAARAHRIAVLLVTLALSMVCFQTFAAHTFAGMLAQSAALAAVALAGVAVSDPSALEVRRASSCARACGFGTGAGAKRGADCRLRRWTAYVLVVGLAAGIASAAAAAFLPADHFGAPEGWSPVQTAARFAAVAAICFLTGVYEEGVFRAIAIDALLPAFAKSRRGVLCAALASSILFGTLHVSAADAAAADGAVTWAQLALKPLQAGLFGFFMAALYVRTRSLWTVAGAHGLFNLLYTGPDLVWGGLSSSYVTGDPVDLALLAATTLLLALPAVAAARDMKEHGR